MIFLPIGKALVPVEFGLQEKCSECFFMNENGFCINKELFCDREDRKDGKNVIFKLVDWPAKEEK